MADEKPAVVAEEKAPPDPNIVSLIAVGSFHELGNFQGRLLHGGDAFTAERSRAVELRANGLVRYADAETEKAAAGDEAPADAAITSRSIKAPAPLVKAIKP